VHLRCSDSVREIMKFLKRKYLDRAGVLRDVEKLHFLQNSKNLGDRKCLGKLRKSFVGHPDTILFSRISRERVFQHPQTFTLRTRFDSTAHTDCFRVADYSRSGPTAAGRKARSVWPDRPIRRTMPVPALMVGSIGRAALHDLPLTPTGKCRLFLKGAAVAESASRSG